MVADALASAALVAPASMPKDKLNIARDCT
jgi:hypothetical protein